MVRAIVHSLSRRARTRGRSGAVVRLLPAELLQHAGRAGVAGVGGPLGRFQNRKKSGLRRVAAKAVERVDLLLAIYFLGLARSATRTISSNLATISGSISSFGRSAANS